VELHINIHHASGHCWKCLQGHGVESQGQTATAIEIQWTWPFLKRINEWMIWHASQQWICHIIQNTSHNQLLTARSGAGPVSDQRQCLNYINYTHIKLHLTPHLTQSTTQSALCQSVWRWNTESRGYHLVRWLAGHWQWVVHEPKWPI